MDLNKMQSLLCSLLDCGYADLTAIEDCQYDWEDILEEHKDMGGEKPDINSLAYAMFSIAKREMQESIEERLESLQYGDLTEEDKLEEDALYYLKPIDDIESFHNYLDTSVYLAQHAVDKADTYKKYCKKEIERFTEMTGYEIC
jgi:hypothetical protein